jgi:hypothetical protein
LLVVGFVVDVAEKGIEVLFCAAKFFKGLAAANCAEQAQAGT